MSSILLSAVPGPKIKTPLKNAVVTEGEDAVFSIELSANLIGTWFLNSQQLQDSGRFSITQSKTQHTLRIQQVPNVYDGAEITFIATGVRDSATLQIKGQYLNGWFKFFFKFFFFLGFSYHVWLNIKMLTDIIPIIHSLMFFHVVPFKVEYEVTTDSFFHVVMYTQVQQIIKKWKNIGCSLCSIHELLIGWRQRNVSLQSIVRKWWNYLIIKDDGSSMIGAVLHMSSDRCHLTESSSFVILIKLCVYIKKN